MPLTRNVSEGLSEAFDNCRDTLARRARIEIANWPLNIAN